MKSWARTFASILMSCLLASVACAQPQVVVQDKFPAGAADAPPPVPSPEVLREAARRLRNAEWLAKAIAEADLVTRVPIRITNYNASRMPPLAYGEPGQTRLGCWVNYLTTNGTSIDVDLYLALEPFLTNGALDTVYEFPIRFAEPGSRAGSYRCALYWAWRSEMCLYNAAGAAAGNCLAEDDVSGSN